MRQKRITFEQLGGIFKRWRISDAVGGGWYAYRLCFVSQKVQERQGLHNLLWTDSLEALAKQLEEQERREGHIINVPS